ncbi:MAG: SGNH/GDSL hydrolase family protein [Crocinitomicaceae bacterium]|nr:SGNH/GDSL hydrolase family protein [Crocinitomicaceae bacterium]
MNWETYIAFGDSITIGARTYLGYPELVGNKLSASLNKHWNVINHSVSGFKAIDLARYTDKHFSSLQEHKSSVTSILIGTNDIKEKTSVDDFKIAMNQIIIKTKFLTSNKNVIIFSIPQFHKGIMYPYSIEMNETISTFNKVINQLAKDHDLRTLDLNHTEKDFFDGVHLNRSGIENFSDQISKYILKDKGIDIG